LDRYFILPEATEGSDPSWFWFVLSLKSDVGFTRRELLEFLGKEKIATRLLFSGNFVKQPAFIDYVKEYRIVGDLKNTDYIMNNSFWIGLFQWLNKEHLDYMVLKFNEFTDGK
jgi:CDP-6-deoxy-D-xylo-4-hexulose-3-dehydrase